VLQYCKIPGSPTAHIPVQYALLKLLRSPEFTQRQFRLALSYRVFFGGGGGDATPCNLLGADYLLEGIFPSSSGFMYKKDYSPFFGPLDP
jgi:hypothetical protein